MSSPAPANRRSGLGSRRFNPLKLLQSKQRLKQKPAASQIPVPVPVPVPAAPEATAPVAIPVPPAFDYCRFIELDYIPMERGCMVSMRPTKGSTAATKSPNKGYTFTKSPDRHSHSTHSSSSPRSRRTAATPSNRDPHGNASLGGSSSNSGSCKGSDCSPTKGRHQKYMSCTDNHGIRPPPPEQYLTPLQQKEVCIRHLRARLKETITTLQDRDTEIDDLRGRLYRMQEDWVEEECQRVEAQLALKGARHEIQQLKEAVDTVRARLSEAGGLSGDVEMQKYFQDINTQNHKLENLLLNMDVAQAGLAKEEESVPNYRTRVGGSAPASVSGESPGGIPRPTLVDRGSYSCDGSPARSLTRSSTYTKLGDHGPADRNGNSSDFPCLSGEGTQDSGFECCGESTVPSRADLLLEAAFLSEETASLLNSYTQTFAHSLPHNLSHTLPRASPRKLANSVPHTMPHSSTFEKLCTSEQAAPFHCSLGGVGCMSHPCLSHHHLYLHSLRETGIQTESCPIPMMAGYPSDLDTIAEQRTFRSQACSPTSTWMSDEGEEELDSITISTSTVRSTVTEPIPASKTPVGLLPRSATMACSMESPLCMLIEDDKRQEEENRLKEDPVNDKQEETRQTEEQQEMQISPVEGNEVEVQVAVVEAAPEKLCDSADTSPVKQDGQTFGACCGEGGHSGTRLENLSVEDRQDACPSAGSTPVDIAELSQSSPVLSPEPHTSQPRRSTSHEEIAGVTIVEVNDEEDEEETEGAVGGAVAEEGPPSDSGAIVKSYWSRHFLVDLLAVAIPVVPTVAWLCRGPYRGGQPMYHFGSLLRGCCTVALHSLRRGGGLRHYPAGGGDLGGSLI